MNGAPVPIHELLTAYADDQLGPEGRQLVERALARDPALAAELAAIRAQQAELRAALAAAPLPGALDPARRARLTTLMPQRQGRSWRLADTVRWQQAAAALAIIGLTMGLVLAVAWTYHAVAGSRQGPLAATADGTAQPGSAESPVVAELDLPVEEIQTEYPVVMESEATGREEAQSANEVAADGAFMAIGGGGGASGAFGAPPVQLPPPTPEARRAKRARAGEPAAEAASAPRPPGIAIDGRAQNRQEGQRLDAIGDRAQAQELQQERADWAKDDDDQSNSYNAVGGVYYGYAEELRGLRPRLQQQVTLNFPETTIEDAVTFVRRISDIDLVLDPAVDPGEVPPLTMQVSDISLAAALHFISLQTGLEAQVRGDQVVLGHRERGWQALNRQGRYQRRYNGERFAELLAARREFAPVDGSLVAALWPVAGILPLELQPGRGEAQQSVALVGGERNVASQALQLARRAGMQAVPAGDQLVIRQDAAPLDPTTHYGLEPAAFTRAFGTSPMVATAEDSQVTFAFDDDTASFDRALMHARRRSDFGGEEIATEHFVNAMPTDYPTARGPEAFDLYAEAAPAPFATRPRTLLVAVGAVARAAAPDERKPLRLTLCLDASGSMARPGGLDRVLPGLHALVDRLDAGDRVDLVAFDDRARLLATGVAGSEGERLHALLRQLDGRGATNAVEGMALAYQVAAESTGPGSTSRVLLVTDGATLVGRDVQAVIERVRRYRGRGIALTIVGCGAQPFAPGSLEQLADAGDGEHRFVGSSEQAKQLFTTRLIPERLGVLARDAKVQVRWNPERVAHHRLIGYQRRRLAHEQFRDDRVDAGELAHASRATALFEIQLHPAGTGALGRFAVRYFDTRYEAVREIGSELSGGIISPRPSPRLRLQACAAATAEWLQGGWWSNVRLLSAERIRRELSSLPRSSARSALELLLAHGERLFADRS